MTLSEMSLQVRIMAKLLAVMVVVLGFFYLLIVLILTAVIKPAEKEVYLNPLYGSIKPPVFEQALSNNNFDYVLDTIDGELPETTRSASVYFIPEPKSTLAYLNKIEGLAQSFAFDTQIYKPQTLSEEWVKYEDQNRILEINIVSFNFRYYYKKTAEFQSIIEATPEAKFTLLEDEFIEKARQELLTRDAYPNYLATGTNNPVYQAYDLAKKEFIAYQEGDNPPQAIRINFFRQEEGMSIFTSTYFDSANYVILSPLSYDNQVVKMQFSSFEKLNDEPGVYPLITSQQAFEKLKKGKASIISLSDKAGKKIKIKKISLGYYDPESYQPYYQPIFVFLGSDNFVAYLPALSDEYLSE